MDFLINQSNITNTTQGYTAKELHDDQAITLIVFYTLYFIILCYQSYAIYVNSSAHYIRRTLGAVSLLGLILSCAVFRIIILIVIRITEKEIEVFEDLPGVFFYFSTVVFWVLGVNRFVNFLDTDVIFRRFFIVLFFACLIPPTLWVIFRTRGTIISSIFISFFYITAILILSLNTLSFCYSKMWHKYKEDNKIDNIDKGKDKVLDNDKGKDKVLDNDKDKNNDKDKDKGKNRDQDIDKDKNNDQDKGKKIEIKI